MKLQKKLYSFLTVFFTLLLSISWAEDPVTWNVKSNHLGNQEYEVTITAHLESGWHLYSQFLKSDEGPLSTYITYNLNGVFETIGLTKEINIENKYDPVWDMEISFFSHIAVFKQKIKSLNPDSLFFTGNVNYMICDETQCLPPDDYSFTVDLSKGQSIEKEVVYKTDSSTLAIIPKLENFDLNAPIIDTCGETEESNKSFWTLLLLGFFGGLISLFTPCVFPMVPLTVSFFTKGGQEKGSGIGKALLYGFSIIIVYVSLSLPFYFQGTDPEVLNKISSSALLNVIFFVIFLVFAFSFFGYYELTLPASWANKADKAADIGGVIGVMFMALVLAIVSFSCTAVSYTHLTLPTKQMV